MMWQSSIPATGRYGHVVPALEGVRNRHAMTGLVGGFLLVGLVVGAGNVMALSGGLALAWFLHLVAALLAVAAVNAAGLALMDAARGAPARDLDALLAAGAASFARFVLAGLLGAAALAAYLLLIALLLWLCAIPYLGALLLIVLLPLAVLVSAVAAAAAVVFFALLAPALWAGNAAGTAAARLVAVVRQRPAETIVSLLLLGGLIVLVGAVCGIFVLAGGALVAGLSSLVLGTPLAGTALAAAGVIGTTLVFAVLASVLAAILLNGLCHIYLRASAGVSDDRTADVLAGWVEPALALVHNARERLSVTARGLRSGRGGGS